MTEKMRLGRASPAGCAGETPTIPAKTNSSAAVNTLFTIHLSSFFIRNRSCCSSISSLAMWKPACRAMAMGRE